LPCDPRVTRRVYYEYVIRIDTKYFDGKTSAEIAEALTAELCLKVSPLYNPLSKKRHILDRTYVDRLDIRNCSFPNAENAYLEHVALPHNVLLGDDRHLQAIGDAVRKVQKYAKEIPRCAS
jgi:dTDP-4-amino-4,6-dideoxygalactose transaminase